MTSILRTSLIVGAAVSCSLLAGLRAQSPIAVSGALAFDVVSVKRNVTDARASSFGGRNGRWTMVHVTTAGLILSAYSSPTEELIGAPSWVTTDRFDIDARASFTPTA